VNVRGALLVSIDTRALLGQSPGDLVSLVVVEVAGRRLALAVDEVEDLQVVPIEALEPADRSAGLPEGSVIALVREARPFLLLDIEALVAPLFGVPTG